MKKFGPHGQLVAEFLEELQETPKEKWVDLFAAYDGPAGVRAIRVIVDTPISASVQSATYSAGLRAYRNLGLTEDDLPDSTILSSTAKKVLVYGMIDSALCAISLGDKLAMEHRRACLEPFATNGFNSAIRALQENPEAP